MLALEALLDAGYTDEALAFRDFLLRVSTGDPTTIQIMYGIGGERRLTEFELPELPGYEDSKPVRVGNGVRAVPARRPRRGRGGDFHRLRGPRQGRAAVMARWRAIVEHVETIWREPDDGIWEARGRSGTTTYSKVMAWVVFDRAVRIAERFELEAPIDRWKRTRDEIHREVCERVDMTASGAHSRSTTGPRSSTPACSTSQSSVSYREPTSASAGPSTRSRASSAATASSLDTDRRDRRRIAGRRGCPGLLVLAGQALACNGRGRRRTPVRAACRPEQRSRPAGRGEHDVARSRQVGNFPQAFSHLTLILAARAISVAEKDAR